MVFDAQRIVEYLEHLACDGRRIAGVLEAGQEGDEFVAAEPGQAIFSQAARQTTRHGRQQAIADRVPE